MGSRRALLIALGVYFALVASVHAYLAGTLAIDVQLPRPWRWFVIGALACGGMTMVLHPAIERLFPPRISRITAWPAYVWMGVCFYLLLGSWASAAVLLLTGWEGVEVARARALIVGGGAFAILPGALVAALRTPRVRRVEVALDRWPRGLDGYRIVQISDIHIGSILRRRFAERLVQRCNALAPDLVAVTGDLVDGAVQHLASEVEPFRALRAPDGVYFVTGNHEYFSGAARWVEKTAELGMRVLANEHVALGRQGARFALAGVHDLSSRRRGHPGGYDLSRALEGIDPGTATVLLAHHPRTFGAATRGGVDLQLSGHTHGGQMWPFVHLVRLQTRFLGGLYGSARSRLYVSRGTGFWGPPMRVLAPAEITELVVRSVPAPV